MGCSASRLEDEEAVQLCKERKNFIKQAIEQRTKFATSHTAYIQSLKQVAIAFRNYVEGDENSDCFSDSFSASPFTPVKRLSPNIVGAPLKNSPPKQIQSKKNSTSEVHYSRSGGNASVLVEERPRSPENVRVNSYHSTENYGMDGIYFGMQSSPMNNSSFFPSSTYDDRPATYPPPSPQNPQWDFFWNPFSSLESYGYPTRNHFDHHIHLTSEDEMASLRQVREEEGIPDLEEEEEVRYEPLRKPPKQEENRPSTSNSNPVKENMSNNQNNAEVNKKRTETTHQVKEFQSQGAGVRILENQNDIELDFSNDKKVHKEINGKREAVEESTPGFTVYVNRRPASMSEVVRDIENQFVRICDSAHEVSGMLEASRALYSSTSNELTAIKMLNPVALFRTASARSTSSRFLPASSSSRDDNFDTSSEFSEDCCMLSGSHQSTLDRLYAWEKKLYEEVKSGERLRMAYEKKCTQLRNQDVNGDDDASVDKTRRSIRDIHTRIKVSIHSIEAISMRIEKLRDDELQPQIVELIQGLTRMWRTMADCHRIQKRTTDEAKLLLAKPKHSEPPPPLIRLARSATNLESELRNWRDCLEGWITAQRAYVHALASWLLRCAPPPDPTMRQVRSPLSPPRSSGAPPIFSICIQWSRLLDSVSEAQAVDGLDFFARGIASVIGQQKEEEVAAKRAGANAKEDMDEGVMVTTTALTTEKMAELAIRVVCAGMSVAVSSLAEFSICSMEGCEELVKRCENGGKEAV